MSKRAPDLLSRWKYAITGHLRGACRAKEDGRDEGVKERRGRREKAHLRFLISCFISCFKAMKILIFEEETIRHDHNSELLL